MGVVSKLKINVRCKIGELLKKEGRSKAWLAREISYGLDKPVPAQMVSDWCANRYALSAAYIYRICKVTGWRIEDIFEEE